MRMEGPYHCPPSQCNLGKLQTSAEPDSIRAILGDDLSSWQAQTGQMPTFVKKTRFRGTCDGGGGCDASPAQGAGRTQASSNPSPCRGQAGLRQATRASPGGPQASPVQCPVFPLGTRVTPGLWEEQQATFCSRSECSRSELSLRLL